MALTAPQLENIRINAALYMAPDSWIRDDEIQYLAVKIGALNAAGVYNDRYDNDLAIVVLERVLGKGVAGERAQSMRELILELRRDGLAAVQAPATGDPDAGGLTPQERADLVANTAAVAEFRMMLASVVSDVQDNATAIGEVRSVPTAVGHAVGEVLTLLADGGYDWSTIGEEQVDAAVRAFLAANPIEGVTPQQLMDAVADEARLRTAADRTHANLAGGVHHAHPHTPDTHSHPYAQVTGGPPANAAPDQTGAQIAALLDALIGDSDWRRQISGADLVSAIDSATGSNVWRTAHTILRTAQQTIALIDSALGTAWKGGGGGTSGITLEQATDAAGALLATLAQMRYDASTNTLTFVDGSIGHSQLGDDSVGGRNLQALSVAEGHIAAGAVTGQKIPRNTIDQNHMAADSVGRSEMRANAVGADEVEDSSLPEGKLDADARAKLNRPAGGTVSAGDGIRGDGSAANQLELDLDDDDFAIRNVAPQGQTPRGQAGLSDRVRTLLGMIGAGGGGVAIGGTDTIRLPAKNFPAVSRRGTSTQSWTLAEIQVVDSGFASLDNVEHVLLASLSDHSAFEVIHAVWDSTDDEIDVTIRNNAGPNARGGDVFSGRVDLTVIRISGGASGLTRAMVLALIEAWARAGSADDIPGPRTFNGLFRSESQAAIPAADARIAFDVGDATDANVVDEIDAEDTSFNISAEQAEEAGAIIRVDWRSGGVQVAARPTDVELLLRVRDTGAVIGRHNLPVTGAAMSGSAEFPVGDAGAKQWAVRVVTAGRYSGEIIVENAHYRSSQALADPAVRQIVHPLLSAEKEERQTIERDLQTEIDETNDRKAIVDAVPIPTELVHKQPTWAAYAGTRQYQTDADAAANTIGADVGEVMIYLPGRGSTGWVPREIATLAHEHIVFDSPAGAFGVHFQGGGKIRLFNFNAGATGRFPGATDPQFERGGYYIWTRPYARPGGGVPAVPPPRVQVVIPAAAATEIDRDNGEIVDLTMNRNIVLQITGGANGDSLLVRATQDVTGSRTLTFHADTEGRAAPTLTTAGESTDYLYFHREGTVWKFLGDRLNI